ncbi:MAG: hypothetical protein R8L07_03345 [Alphaproteobacteria bacterium]|nr:hypothetical protein [Alphaproteobacteria bacterium]
MSNLIDPARIVASGIHPVHLRDHVIRPVLTYLERKTGRTGWTGPAPERLLIGTALAESRGGHWLVQLGRGPARGIFQMEPATHDDIWKNWLAFRPKEGEAVEDLRAVVVPTAHLKQDGACQADEMVWNLAYAAALARIRYRRVPDALPSANDLDGLGRYWKQHYNTPAGKGRAEEFTDLLRAAVDAFGV